VFIVIIVNAEVHWYFEGTTEKSGTCIF